MSDLSKVLGDLYGESNPDGPPVTRELSAEERVNAAEAVDEDLAQVLSSALSTIPASPNSAEAAEEWAEKLETREARQSDRLWSRSDDDIVPSWDRGKRRKKR